MYKRGALLAIFRQEQSIKNSCCSTWKQELISNVFSERCEKASGDETLLSVTLNDGVKPRSEIDLKDNSSENKNNYKKVYIGDIAYNTMRMWQGASGVSNYTGIVSPAYTVIYPKVPSEQNMKFWSFYFKHPDLINEFQKYSQGLTSDTWNLKFAQLATIKVSIPSYYEQCRIAGFFTSLEHLITAEYEMLNSFTNIKKTLLQQMFI